jgi:hypothetical protein
MFGSLRGGLPCPPQGHLAQAWPHGHLHMVSGQHGHGVTSQHNM